MKRKISLLLAFVMIFSLLPMTVAGNTPLPANTHTGHNWEGTVGPSVRHMDRGQLVGRLDAIQAFRAALPASTSATVNHLISGHNLAGNYPTVNHAYLQRDRYVNAPVGNLRHMLVSSTIFHNQSPVNNNHVQVMLTLENAYWMLGLINTNTLPTAYANGWNPAIDGSFAEMQTSAGALGLWPLVNAQMNFGNTIAWTQIEDYDAAVPTGMFAWIQSVPNYETQNPLRANARNVAMLNVVRTDSLTGNYLTSTPLQTRLPVEYVTRSGANDNPVRVLLNPVGVVHNVNPILTLSGLVESRLNITRAGAADTLRHFHGYSAALVYEGIRIQEIAHGGFAAVDPAAPHNYLWVELEITTPGFYWATQPTDSPISIRYQPGTNLETNLDAPYPNSVVRSGTSRAREGNNFIRMIVPVNNQNRTQTAWFQINNLRVQASSRARAGDVEVYVRVHHATTTGAVDAGTQGSWTWNVFQYHDDAGEVGQRVGTYAGDIQHVIRNEFAPAWNARFNGRERLLPALPQQPQFAGERQFPHTAVDGTVVPYREWLSFEGEAGWWSLVWHWTPAGAGAVGNWARGREIDTAEIVVARFGDLGLEFYLYDDEPYELRSGMQEWTMSAAANNMYNPTAAMADYHRTARAVLRELSPGSIPSMARTYFTFPEGIQILGVRMWTNNAHFAIGNNTNQYVWFDGSSSGVGNFLNAHIQDNVLTIRPEFNAPRYRLANIRFRFYISIMPGFEAAFGSEIPVTAETRDGVVDSVVVAEAWDPIYVETNYVTIDDTGQAVFGQFRNEPIGNVTVTTTTDVSLSTGDVLWLGVEGGIGRGWGGADHVSITAARAVVGGTTSNLVLSAPHVDSHGVSVRVIRGTAEAGTTITFEDVAISGRLIPGHTYSIIVAGDSVADNWAQFDWLQPGIFARLGRNIHHGFFSEEPYATVAFTFQGDDAALTQGPPQIQLPPGSQAVTFWQTSSHTLRDGDVVSAPVFVLQPNLTNPRYVTSYVSARVVADLAGLPWGNGFSTWDDATGTATFTNGEVTIAFTAGSSVAVVNGVDTPITAGGLSADARVIGGRMMVPISFFNTIPWFPLNVRWNSYVDPSQRSITITPIGQ